MVSYSKSQRIKGKFLVEYNYILITLGCCDKGSFRPVSRNPEVVDPSVRWDDNVTYGFDKDFWEGNPLPPWQ